MNSVKLNVNNQVRCAMGKFEEEVLSGKLTVVGAVYDFRNEMAQGQGKLVVVNVNGETDPAKIAKLDLMQGLDAPPKAEGRQASRPRPPQACDATNPTNQGRNGASWNASTISAPARRFCRVKSSNRRATNWSTGRAAACRSWKCRIAARNTWASRPRPRPICAS
jgi:hypothetical protein